MDKDLSIVIATYNRAKSLNNCLYSLTKQTDQTFSVLIIDGEADNKTHSVIKKYKNKLSIHTIIDKTPHLSYIRDLGWRAATTPGVLRSKSPGVNVESGIVAWLDDDTVADPQWAETVKKSFKAGPLGSFKAKHLAPAGITGPTIIPENLLKKRDAFFFHTKNSLQFPTHMRAKLKKFFSHIYFNLFMQGEKYGIGKIYPSGAWSPGSNFPQSRKLNKPIEVDYLEACNFAVQREVLEKIGGFDLSYKDASEWCEVDLAFRIRKAGYKLIFDPKMAVKHRVSRSGVYPRRFRPISRLKNFLRFYTKTYYPKSIKGWLLFILYLHFLLSYYFYLWIKRKPS